VSLRIGSLCSGYGGLDLAVMDALPGAELAWHAQYEPPDKKGKPDLNQWAAQVLELRFPGAPNHGDITAIDYGRVEPVDILTAGFPCQDISLAGGRAGLLPGNRSGLWSHVARAITELRPRLVFIENVRSLTSARAHSDLEPCAQCVGGGGSQPALRALGAVLGDLAALGFDAEWICVPASGVGACHKRERAFVLAWPASAAPDPDRLGTHRSGSRRAGRPEPAHRRDAAPDTEGDGRHEGGAEPARQLGGPDAALAGGAAGVDWGVFAPAVARHEHTFGCVAPSPLNERGRLSPRFVEWMMGLPAGWVTDVPDIPTNAQLKALGNGVIPRQGAAAFRILAERMTAGVIPADGPAKAPAFEVLPLFEETPVLQPATAPLGAPPSWTRVVVTRAKSQCECTGGCGATHSRTAGRCALRHGGWANRREVRLILAPRKPLTPVHQAVA
jgi:DNA (cytosine-5)-methyltransferase 1